MYIDFINCDNDQIADIAFQILNSAELSKEEDIAKVVEWVSTVFVDVSLVSLLMKKFIRIAGVDSFGNLTFTEGENYNLDKKDNYDSLIWKSISEIIKLKDENFPN